MREIDCLRCGARMKYIDRKSTQADVVLRMERPEEDEI